MSKENFEKSEEKFPHLWKMPPEIKAITKLNPHDVSKNHLWFLDEHLEWLQIKFPDISTEIEETRAKIRIAMWLEPNISKEVLIAANDPDYKRQYRSVS